jgi:hypothetical protein
MSAVAVAKVNAAAPAYQIQTLGLTDATHTSPGGDRASTADGLNAAGQVIGRSTIYVGGLDIGQSAWLYSGGVHTRIGFYDAAHTDVDGLQSSHALAINASGQVVGTSARFNNTDPAGTSAWLYNSGVTTRLGYTDAVHTNTDGSQVTYLSGFNNAGQAAGESERYGGFVSPGLTGWIYSGGTTSRIGLFGGNYTGANNYEYTSVIALNSAGQATGHSDIYQPVLGDAAWFYSGGTTTRIGYVDAEHTDADGSQSSFPSFLSDAGHVSGVSFRYNGGAYIGLTSWMYHAGTTTRIGLVDAEHTDFDGYRYSDVWFADNSGRAAGYSERWAGGEWLGTSAWLYDGSNTIRLGLLDAEHTDSVQNFQDNEPTLMSQAGQVAGFAERFAGGLHRGYSAWVYVNGSTRKIGLTDAQHTAPDGYRYSDPRVINDAGQVAGIADRYSPTDDYLGQSGWFYDPVANSSTPLVFSDDGAGYAWTDPRFLTGSGVVLGVYEKFTAGTSQGQFPFFWSAGDGFHELAGLVSGGIGTAGWQSLSNVVGVRGNSPAYIVGEGVRTEGSMAYLLSLVPGGGGAWLNPAGGSWHSGANWSFGNPPSSGDDAIFNLNATYAVTLAQNAAAHDLVVSAGSVTLNLAGHRLDVANMTNISSQLKITNGALRTTSVTVAGTLDLSDNDMIVDYTGPSPLAAVRTLISTGHITSSAATISTTLGIGDNAVLGLTSFAGQTVDPSSVLVKYTYRGDSNLDGKVDVTDLGNLATNWQTSGVWTSGDFDYNGFINVNDLGMLATNWQAGVGNPLGPDSLADALSSFGLPPVSVPEPGALGLLMCAALLHRRRDR